LRQQKRESLHHGLQGHFRRQPHIIELRDPFETRMPLEFRDRAPRMVRGKDGKVLVGNAVRVFELS
jgi:hypothetical protein